MAESPLFSIITITFDNLAGLQETVESVRGQSFRDFEHIVVDGDSADGTPDWLDREFTGAWTSEPDRGRYDAMNKGARSARGQYLWFMHAGDIFGDGTVLERVAEALKDGPEWLYGLARVVNADKSLQGTLGYVPFSLFNFAILGRSIPHQATAMKRDLFWRLGGYDERFAVAADQLLLLQAADRSEPIALPDFLCDFDATGISAGRRWWIDYWDGQKVRRRLSHPVTRSRALDSAISLTYAIVRQVGRFGRQVMAASGAGADGAGSHETQPKVHGES